ncbi:MAG: outer membrane beta-barrel protein [Gemmatimonadetes bacterium]|nr:outer membrane beta-barrel protein [Gemmatimonadota bacterium]
MRLRAQALTIAFLSGFAAAAPAQVASGQFQLTPYGGFLWADKSAALDDAPVVGLEGVYYASTNIAFGFYGSFTRGQSDGSYFPAMQWDVGPDTTRLFHVGQDLSIATYGGVLKLGMTFGRIAPYVAGGIGGYTFFLDPQSNDQPQVMSGTTFEAGGGFHLGLTQRTGLRVDVRDVVFTDYDRDKLNPVQERFRSTVFLHARPPAAESTVHNLRAAIGFTYLPGR